MPDKNQEDLKSELLEISNNIMELKQDKVKIICDIKTDIKKWCGKHIGWTIGGISLLTIYALFQIYSTVINKSEDFITNEITIKFAEPQISQTLNDVAENQAKEIIEQHLNPSIQKAIATVNQKIDDFEVNLNRFKTSYDKQLNDLAKEVEYLKNRNMVLRLRDKAIATADTPSLEKLEKFYHSTTDEALKMSAASEILQVKQSFINTSRIKGLEITYVYPQTGKRFEGNKIPTEALIQALSDNVKWQYRARAVELLVGRKEKQVPEALLNTIQNDNNLEVRSKAIATFESITNFKSRDVLDSKPVINWWNKNNKDVELKELQTIQSVIEETKEEKQKN